MTGFAVRTARASEYGAIGRLTVAAYLEDGQLGTENNYETVLEAVADRAAHGEVLVAVDGDRVLGSVTFVLAGSRFAELSRPGEAEFRMLAVDPEAQGRGVGEALTRACVDLAVAHGCTALVLSARDFSARARRLYERIGFVRTPELDWTPVRGVDLVAMRLDLKQATV